MSVGGLAVFCTALFFGAALPGPGIAAIVARVLGRGAAGAIAFTSGIAMGDVVWLTLAICGLAVIAHTMNIAFLIVKWIGVFYLLFLAWKIWKSEPVAQNIATDGHSESTAKLFLAGLSVTMGNPKVMTFYLALLPTILDMTHISAIGYLELVLATLGVLALVFGGYVGVASRARFLFTSPKAARVANRSSAIVMTGSAVWVATR